MLLNLVDKLAHKIYYKFNPIEFKRITWTYLPGSRLKRLIEDKYGIRKAFEYIEIKSTNVELDVYVVNYYTVIYKYTSFGFVNNADKQVLNQELNISKKELESFCHELIDINRFNEGISMKEVKK